MSVIARIHQTPTFGSEQTALSRSPNRLSLLFWALLAGIFVPFVEAQGNSHPQQSPCIDSLLIPCDPAASSLSPSTYPQQQMQSNGNQTNSSQDMSGQTNDTRATERMQDAGTTSRIYVDSAGNEVVQREGNDLRSRQFPPDPVTDLQRLARSSLGEMLPVFGRNFFELAPSTFAPGDQIPVTPDYIVGPGDDILLRLSGPETFNSQLTVDRSGSIYVPKVGSIHVAGLRFDELQQQISAEFSHTYRNFRLSVNLGRLRSIQVYVVGEARRPGAYTISSLSTVLNALFASGGPDVQGSLRHIQIRRAGQTLTDFDLYDLVLHGDQSKEVHLQSGDTIFIPPVGPQVALGGSVRHPAIYELKNGSTLGDVLALAGGFSATAASTEITLDRIDTDLSRRAMKVMVDAAGRSLSLRDGDVLYAGHITAAFTQTVTIRGNLANPGRFAWHEGMRLADIIPDRQSLLTTDYWRERNRLGVPVPLFQPSVSVPRPYNRNNSSQNNRSTSSNSRDALLGQPPSGQTNDFQQQVDAYGVPIDQYSQYNQYNEAGQLISPAQPGILLPGITSSPQGYSQGSDTQQQNRNGMALPGTLAQGQGNEPVRTPQTSIRIPAPEIDWSYAVIERLDPLTLKSSLVSFNLGLLIKDHEAGQNLTLQPGDIVTILSQNDILVPLDEQTKYIRLEGEFKGAGVYSVSPNETLNELVQRAGGLTGKAYLYGSSFQRESARLFQQQRLDEYVSTLSTDMERAAAVRTASSSSGVLDPNALAEQRSLIAQLRQLRATGRIVLEFGPTSEGIASIPPVPLENGDVFRIPSRPNTVSVIGAVYGQNVFLYDQSRKLEDYVSLAGDPNRIADRRHAFIIRADGSVFSRERAKGVLSNHFNDARINPGDSIVIPEKLIKPSALRSLIDYSQILSSFGLAAAAINVVR